MRFKHFLLNEDGSSRTGYLAQKIGDLLSALQDLDQNAQHIGTRQQVKNAEEIVNYIRRILHTHWEKSEEEYLRVLQKVGVAIMRGIDEKDDLPSIITSATHEIEKVMSDLGVPVNNLGSPEESEPDTNEPSVPDTQSDLPQQ